MAATTIQRALTCSPRAVAMIAKAIAPSMPTRTQGPCDRRVVAMVFSIPVRFVLLMGMHRDNAREEQAVAGQPLIEPARVQLKGPQPRIGRGTQPCGSWRSG